MEQVLLTFDLNEKFFFSHFYGTSRIRARKRIIKTAECGYKIKPGNEQHNGHLVKSYCSVLLRSPETNATLGPANQSPQFNFQKVLQAVP